MKQTEKKSFVQMMNLLMGIQMATVSVLLIIFVAVTYRAARKDTYIAAENVLHIYAAQIENRIRKVDMQLTTIIDEEMDFQLLDGGDETESYYASVRLHEVINDIMKIDQSADIFVIAQARQNICIDARADNFPYEWKSSIRDMAMDYVRSGRQTEGWQFGQIEGTVYFYKAIVKGQHVVMAAITADSLLKTVSLGSVNTYGFVLADRADMVQAYAGCELFGDKGTGIGVDSLKAGKTIVNGEKLMDGGMGLYSFEKKSNVFRHFYKNALLLLVVIVLLCVFDLYFMKIQRKHIILPMNGMVEDMEQIGGGNYDLRVAQRGENREFSLLAHTFNRLMDEIFHLKIRFYEKQLALSDAEQKYIRLQIRPHFFLNAMTTISGLSAKNKNREIEKYIAALSKNIRYMFSSGLHTVPVKEEVHHVENYFEMQEMRYPGCVFYFIEMPQELENWKIPQMLIHTLVENEYKYGIEKGSSLMVLIKISAASWEGEEMLLVEVEDDGKGYPPEVIAYMNHASQKPGEDKARVGLWSIRRLLELMYDRKNLFQVSNVEPHGALNRIYIPREPVNERGKEYMGEQGIQ